MYHKFLGITVTAFDKSEYDIQFELAKYKDLDSFIQINQTVLKTNNSAFISISDTNNITKTIAYPGCDIKN
jgi:hypothetical protein